MQRRDGLFSILRLFVSLIILALVLFTSVKLISHSRAHKKHSKVHVLAANETKNTAASSLPNNVSPTPPLKQGDQTKRLRFTNQCPYPIWIQQDFKHSTNDPVVVLIPQNQYYDYNVPAEASSLRFWPKAGNCNQYGYNCDVGESVGVPDAISAGQQTTKTFMSDINSKFEITFDKELTYFDASAVDGYTFAFQVLIKAPASEGGLCYYEPQKGNTIFTKIAPNDSILYIDCSKLDPAKFCPAGEDLSKSLNYLTTASPMTSFNGVPLTSVDLRYAPKGSDTVVGCFSPCGKITFGQEGGWATKDKLGEGIKPEDPVAKYFCCPGNDKMRALCKAGPAAKSDFLDSVQASNKGACNAYAYAYNDAKGEMVCSAATMYEVIICPNGNFIPLPAKPAQCSDEKPCEAGQICENGKCVPAAECDANKPCPAGQLCKDGKCVTTPPSCKAECAAGDHCPDRFACSNLPASEAGCCDNHMTPCKKGCEANDTCPDGTRCPTEGVGQYCCDAHMTPAKQCVHACAGNDFCPDRFKCSNLTGTEAGCCDNHLTPCKAGCDEGDRCPDGTSCATQGVGQYCCDTHMTPAKQCVHQCNLGINQHCPDGFLCDNLPGDEAKCCDNHMTPCKAGCGVGNYCPDGTACPLTGIGQFCCDAHQKQ